MPKKPGENPPSDAAPHGDAGPPDSAAAETPDGQPPELDAAEAAVRRAKAELKKAEEVYHQIRREATDQLKRARESTVADLVDGTLKLVKRYPGPGVVVAAVIGFFLGRLFRR